MSFRREICCLGNWKRKVKPFHRLFFKFALFFFWKLLAKLNVFVLFILHFFFSFWVIYLGYIFKVKSDRGWIDTLEAIFYLQELQLSIYFCNQSGQPLLHLHNLIVSRQTIRESKKLFTVNIVNTYSFFQLFPCLVLSKWSPWIFAQKLTKWVNELFIHFTLLIILYFKG